MRMLALSAMLALCIQLAADARDQPFTGKFTNGFDRYPNVSLTLLQQGTRVRGMISIVGDSAASRVVTADIDGRIVHGVLSFAWQDSFENAGRATFRPDAKSWLLGSRITRPANDGRYFEGSFKLTRVSTHVTEADLPRP
ncbi:MAG: hypothetical protein JWM80_6264 [Cyanobacteria bacterium RYN_339]|nr:hypothetical protein [Cyanobacteria bacterium RYN_339]